MLSNLNNVKVSYLKYTHYYNMKLLKNHEIMFHFIFRSNVFLKNKDYIIVRFDCLNSRCKSAFIKS